MSSGIATGGLILCRWEYSGISAPFLRTGLQQTYSWTNSGGLWVGVREKCCQLFSLKVDNQNQEVCCSFCNQLIVQSLGDVADNPKVRLHDKVAFLAQYIQIKPLTFYTGGCRAWDYMDNNMHCVQCAGDAHCIHLQTLQISLRLFGVKLSNRLLTKEIWSEYPQGSN